MKYRCPNCGTEIETEKKFEEEIGNQVVRVSLEIDRLKKDILAVSSKDIDNIALDQTIELRKRIEEIQGKSSETEKRLSETDKKMKYYCPNCDTEIKMKSDVWAILEQLKTEIEWLKQETNLLSYAKHDIILYQNVELKKRLNEALGSLNMIAEFMVERNKTVEALKEENTGLQEKIQKLSSQIVRIFSLDSTNSADKESRYSVLPSDDHLPLTALLEDQLKERKEKLADLQKQLNEMRR